MKNWFVGDIEGGSRKCVIVTVENINEETMTNIILEYVNMGSYIISYKWKVYKKALKLIL